MEAPSDLEKWMRNEGRFWEGARERQGFGRRLILALFIGALLYLLRSCAAPFQ